MSRADGDPDWYALLGVGPSADAQEIRQAYKREALRHHPDKNQDRVEEATEMFKLVAEAYTVLSDRQSRADYDACRGRGTVHGPPGFQAGGGAAGFTAGRASEVFREVFGDRFISGLLRAAREAAPHVHAAARATKSVIASAWDHLTSPQEEPPMPGFPPSGFAEADVVHTAAAPAEADIAPAAAAPMEVPTAARSAGRTPLGVVSALEGRRQLRCTMRWIAAGGGADPDLALSAYLAGSGGLLLGCVDRQLRQHAPNVAAQFRECGVEHVGGEPPADYAPQREEVIALDVERLTTNEMCRYAFLWVGAPAGGPGRPSGPAPVDLEVASAADGESLFTVEITGCSALRDECGVVAAALVRDGEAWWAIPTLLPCGVEGLADVAAEDTVARLSREADGYLERHRQERREAEEVAAAISAVEAAIASDCSVAPEASSFADEERLAAKVAARAESGDLSGAVEAQEALIRRLMERDESEGGDLWQSRISAEFLRMDELWSRVSESGAAESSSSPARSSGARPAQDGREL